MKKALLLLLIASFFSACQKESLTLLNQEDYSVTLRDDDPEPKPCETECIDPSEKSYFPETQEQVIEWGNPCDPVFSKTVTLTVYNTDTHFVFEVSSTNGFANVVINEGQPAPPTDPNAINTYFIDLPDGWQACDLLEFEVKVNGDGPQAVFTGEYYLVGVCAVEPPCEWREETGFGGEHKGAGAAWWFYIDTDDYNGVDPLVQPIYAGQKLTDATVTWDGENLTIDLGSWSLQDDDEAVKVKGYDTLPSKRPPGGQLNLYKGTELVIPGDGSRYYVVHLDLRICEEIPPVDEAPLDGSLPMSM
jgi:hypothetical protein